MAPKRKSASGAAADAAPPKKPASKPASPCASPRASPRTSPRTKKPAAAASPAEAEAVGEAAGDAEAVAEAALAAKPAAKSPRKKSSPRKASSPPAAATPANEPAAEPEAEPALECAPKPAAKKPAARKKKKKKKADADADAEAAPEEEKKPKAKKAKKPPPGPIERKLGPRAAAPAGAATLKVVSINVAGLRAVLDPDKPPAKREALAALVAREDPDVLCLNEHKLKEEDVEQATERLEAVLPAYVNSKSRWACSTAKKGYSGVAILVKAGGAADVAEATVAEGMPGVADDDEIVTAEGRVLTLTLPALAVVATYVPNSGQQLQRLEYRTKAEDGWDAKMARYVKRFDRPVAVIGDLNCCVNAADFHNAYVRPNFDAMRAGEVPVAEQYVGLSGPKKQAGLTAEERTSFGAMLEAGGLADSFRRQHPDATGVFSYYSQRFGAAIREANKGLRLDYVLVTEGLLKPDATPRLVDSFVLSDADTPQIADHLPVGGLFVL